MLVETPESDFQKTASSKFRKTENSLLLPVVSHYGQILDTHGLATGQDRTRSEVPELEETALPQWTAPLSRGPTRLAGARRSSTEFSIFFSPLVNLRVLCLSRGAADMKSMFHIEVRRRQITRDSMTSIQSTGSRTKWTAV